MKRLVITADDFGAAAAVNEAVEEAHRRGVLTSASLMVGGDHCDDAVARARRNPTLRVGLHLVLVEGRPVSPPSALPDLVGADGRFRIDMAALGREIFFKPDVRRQVATEIEAQFEAFARTGLALDHMNAHKHFHLHPTIGALALRIGLHYGLRASRAPIEPRSVLAAVEGVGVSHAYVTEPWARLLRGRYRRRGVMMADQVFGLAWSGAMTAERLCGLVRRLPDGLTEIYMHPAVHGDFADAAPGYRYGDEFAALVSPEAAFTVREGGVLLGSFSDFRQ